MSKTITITDIADLRVGDIATLSYKGYKFSGEVWRDDAGGLRVGNSIIRYPSGSPGDSLTLVSATREVPDLPTKLGSVIANVVTRDGGHYDWAMLADPMDVAGLSWVVSCPGEYDWVHPDQIISWTPCTVEVQEDAD